MDVRQAVMSDLSQLKSMYREIIKHMDENQLQIWDEVYPCGFFEEDIKKNRLYVLVNENEIISAFALCDKSSGEMKVEWKSKRECSMYLERLGVNVNYIGNGMGTLALSKAKAAAKALGAGYLRLFVVDINKTAINLYVKNGFKRVVGIYDEVIDDSLVLHEYGYEIALSSEGQT